MSPDLPTLLQGLKAVSVPIIAVLSFYIAYRHWRTDHEKVKLERFDRRLAAYQRLKDAVEPIAASGKVRNEDADRFKQAMYDMRFLFDEEMERYVGQIYRAMLDKHTLDNHLEGASDKEKALLKSSDLFTLITNGIYKEVPDRMEKFMR